MTLLQAQRVCDHWGIGQLEGVENLGQLGSFASVECLYRLKISQGRYILVAHGEHDDEEWPTVNRLIEQIFGHPKQLIIVESAIISTASVHALGRYFSLWRLAN